MTAPTLLVSEARRAKPVNGSRNGKALHGVDSEISISVPHLRPFFGYYGGKWRDAIKHYPEPQYGTIVEPFAGSAGFSLRHARRDVILCEVDPVLAEVWRYLIRVEAKEILSIPDLAPDESVDDLDIPQEAKWLVGFWLNRGAASPRKSPSKWMRDGIRPGSFWGDRVRNTIASQVDSIRHWQLHNCSYDECPTPHGDLEHRPSVPSSRQPLPLRVQADRLCGARGLVSFEAWPGHRLRERRSHLAPVS